MPYDNRKPLKAGQARRRLHGRGIEYKSCPHGWYPGTYDTFKVELYNLNNEYQECPKCKHEREIARLKSGEMSGVELSFSLIGALIKLIFWLAVAAGFIWVIVLFVQQGG